MGRNKASRPKGKFTLRKDNEGNDAVIYLLNVILIVYMVNPSAR
jgi:hypothetical protein